MTANSPDPGRCVRHGGVEPFPAPACPDCGGGAASRPPESAVAGGSGDPGGAAPPVMALDPDALRGVANEAAARAEELLAVVTAAGPWLADVPGDLRTIAVLRSCATNRLADATALTDRIGAVASKLTDTVTEYATVDDDLAARLTAMLAERE